MDREFTEATLEKMTESIDLLRAEEYRNICELAEYAYHCDVVYGTCTLCPYPENTLQTDIWAKRYAHCAEVYARAPQVGLQAAGDNKSRLKVDWHWWSVFFEAGGALSCFARLANFEKRRHLGAEVRN